MTDELRAGLVRALERLADDLTVGRYDDPHVGFVVLVHPDRHPSIAVISPVGATDLGSIGTAKDETEEERKKREAKGRFFDAEDFRLAHYALDDAWMAWSMSGFALKEDDPRNLGAYLMEEVKEQYEARRDHKLTAALEKAEWERIHSAICEKCGRRFTERGLPMHVSRSACGREIDPEGFRHCRRCPERRRNHPDGGPCDYPGCSCPGFELAVDTSGHQE